MVGSDFTNIYNEFEGYYCELIKEKKLKSEVKKKPEDANKEAENQEENEHINSDNELEVEGAETKDKMLTHFMSYFKIFEEKVITVYPKPENWNDNNYEATPEYKDQEAMLFKNVRRHICQLKLIQYMQYPKKLEELSKFAN